MNQILSWIDRHTTLPTDTELERVRKRILVVLPVLGVLTGGVYAVFFALLGYWFAFFTLAIWVVYQTTLIMLWMFRWKHMRYYVLLLSLGLAAALGGLHLFLGGFVQSGAGIVYTIFPTLYAIIGGNRRLGLVMLVLFVIEIVLFAIFEPQIRAAGPLVPEGISRALFAVNISGIALFTVVAMSIVISELENARAQADGLLLNILPRPIAEQLKRRPEIIADGFDEVTVLFADIVDFTRMSASVDPREVVNMLNEVFSDFDVLAQKYGLEKIKTIGDAYMVAGGLPTPRPDHDEAIVSFALDMLKLLENRRAWNDQPIRVRIGINTGPVVAGVIGRHKFIYDLWGDAVNTASRMESHGLGNTIQVTESTYQRLKDRYEFESRGIITIKGKGDMNTYLLRGRKALAAT